MDSCNYHYWADTICKELHHNLRAVNMSEAENLIENIQKANRLFFAAAGRSRLMLNGFAMRLMQFGFDCHIVGEVTTPAIQQKDVLLIASGSGETESLTIIAKKAGKAGAKLLLLTADDKSTLAGMCDETVVLPYIPSLQAGASAFEQTLLLFGDLLVMMLASEKKIADVTHEVLSRHANLE